MATGADEDHDEPTDDSTATVDEKGEPTRVRLLSESDSVKIELPPRFEPKRIIGKGGMGVVVEVLDRNLGRLVAVKVLASDKRDPVHRVRFRREAKAAAVLRHPNIVTVHDVDTQRDFIVMELVNGESLRDWLKRDGKLSRADVRRIGLALLDALDAAHEAKIVHRDIKPANILIDERGVVKLVDFGIASFGDRDLTSTGVRIGTPAYMAPEQLRGRVADVRADLYAVGATLFEAATGMQLHADARTPQSAGAEVAAATGDAALARAIEKAIADLPEDRFQTARELADAIGRGDDEPSPRASPSPALVVPDVTPPPTPVPAPAPARRVRWPYAVALVAVVGITGVAIAMRGHARQPSVTGRDAQSAVHTIAVLPFTDHTGESRLDFSTSGLSDILATELKGIPELEVFGYYQLIGRVSDASAPLPEWRDTAKKLGADLVVDGDLMPDPGGIRVVVTLESIDGATIRRFERVTVIDNVPSTTRAIAADIARAAIGRATSANAEARKFDVDRYLQKAIHAIEQQDLAVADDYLKRVELQDPDLAEAQYYRALLNWWLSRKIEEPVARALSGNLDPAQRGFMEGLRLVYNQNNLTAAIAKFRELAAKYPDHRDIQYGLFEALYHGGYPEEALAVYRRLCGTRPTFRLGIKHALAYYIGHADEDGMTWALPRLDPASDETAAWQARSLVARRDYTAAIERLRRQDPRGSNRDLKSELVAIYFLAGQYDLAADTAAMWPVQDVAKNAVHLLGMGLARGRAEEAAIWSRKAASAADLATGDDARERGWLELAEIELADPDPTRLAPIAKSLQGASGINGALARVLVGGALGDHSTIESAHTSEFPEVAAIADAYEAEWKHDAKAAGTAWRRATTYAADGLFVVTEQMGVARAARDAGDLEAVIRECDEVIRPRRFTWAWGGSVGPCLRWTAEAATALGQREQARAAWTSLLALRSKASASDELAAAAHAALGR